MRHVPPYRTSAGPEAVKLAASCGLILDPWQASDLTDALGEDDQGRWAALNVAEIVGRQNGKGSILEARVLAGLNLFGEKLIMWTAHEMKTAFEAFLRIEALIEANRDLKRLVKPNGITRGNGKEAIELRSGARLRFVARSSGSGRGFSGDLVILDEAYALTDDQLSALMPTLSARPNPQVWFTSSPPLTSDTGGPLFSLRDAALAGTDGLAYFDYGVQGVDLNDLSSLDLDDRDLWAEHNPAFGYRLSERFTSNERSVMTDEDFARERLGVWPPRLGGAGLIDAGMWSASADRAREIGESVVFAVDITPDRRYGVIVMYTRGPDGKGLVEIVEQRRGTDWMVGQIVRLRSDWNPVAICLDAKGPAGSLLMDLSKAGIAEPDDPERPAYGDLIVPSSTEVGAACGQIVDAVNRGELLHRDQTPLNAAVNGAKTRPLGDAWGWGRKASTVDISPLVAATLARWAYESRIDIVTARPYRALDNIW